MGSIDTLYPGRSLTLRTHLFPEMYRDLVAVKAESDQGDHDVIYIHEYPEPDRIEDRIDDLERRVSNIENILDDIKRALEYIFNGGVTPCGEYGYERTTC